MFVQSIFKHIYVPNEMIMIEILGLTTLGVQTFEGGTES